MKWKATISDVVVSSLPLEKFNENIAERIAPTNKYS